MLHNCVERPNVEAMVRAFYAKVMQDDLLAPIFTRALGSDFKEPKWHEHLHTLYNFWLMMMTGEKEIYWGHPFPPHAFLGPLTREMFERWLSLFNETVHEHYTPEIAQKYYSKANTLAEQFIENLDIDNDDDD